MRIAVMAAGAVGGYFGARLAAAGHDVTFIARGAHLDAIRRRGLKVESTLGDLHLRDAKATSEASTVGSVDIVLFAVKLWDTEEAGRTTRPLVGPTTRVITLQNGVDSVERLAPILGEDHVVGGTAHIASVVAAPGIIRHTSQFARIRCGRVDGGDDSLLARFTESARAAGIDAAVSDTIDLDRWKKFVFLVALSDATGVTRQPEVIAVGHAKSVPLPPDFIDDQIKFAEAAPPTMKASLLHDLERGNRLELDWLGGKVVALGRELDVPTPANAAVYAALKFSRMGGR